MGLHGAITGLHPEPCQQLWGEQGPHAEGMPGRHRLGAGPWRGEGMLVLSVSTPRENDRQQKPLFSLETKRA